MSLEIVPWFLENGGVLHPNVHVAWNEQDGRGYRLQYAKSAEVQDASSLEEEVIVSLPRKICFSFLQIPTIAPWWPTDWINSLDSTVLTRLLLIEAYLLGESCFFWPYIQILPQPTDERPFSTPLYWTKDEFEVLKGTNLYHAAGSRLRQWSEELDKAKGALIKLCPQKLEHLEHYNFNLYKWAATVLTSRCFPGRLINPTKDHHSMAALDQQSNFTLSNPYREWQEQGAGYKYPALLPLLDFANHDSSAKVTWKSTDDTIELITNLPRTGMSEIVNNYGQKSNEELILGYGFDISDNRANQVSLALPIGNSPKVKLIEYARESMRRDDMSFDLDAGLGRLDRGASSQIYGLRADFHPLSSAAAAPLAFLAMNTRQLYHQYLNPFETPVFASNRFPTQLDVSCAAQFLAKLSQDRLAIGEFDLPEDDGNLSKSKKIALNYRRNQLELLDSAIKSCQRTVAIWKRTGRVANLEDLLTEVLPPEPLKLYRQIVHRILGTRNADKIIARGHDELAFVLWYMSIFKYLEQYAFGLPELSESRDTLSLKQVQSYLQNLIKGYGPPGHSENYAEPDQLSRIEEACLSEAYHDHVAEVIEPYKELVQNSGISETYGFAKFIVHFDVDIAQASLHEMLAWSLRVFAEESVVLQVASADIESESNDSGISELFETCLVLEEGDP